MEHEFRIAVVCSSNQNRSMEAHSFLSKKGFVSNLLAQATWSSFQDLLLTNQTYMISIFESREKNDEQAVHIINIDIQDNHEEATIGAFMICELVTMLFASEDWTMRLMKFSKNLSTKSVFNL
nr:RNA polymerase II subunit A C-terminal domain phosphatase SSU72-like [Biomphalaria glabrata]